MENKINIAELLKDCPQGMELDCTLFEGLEFDGIVDNEYLPIRCRVKNPNGGYNVYNFTKYGCWIDTTFAKCVIFPKGKTTWEGFQRPFKDGGVVYIKTKGHNHNEFIVIFKKITNDHIHKYVCFAYKTLYTDKSAVCHLVDIEEIRLATEEEKQKLFDAIKANGYKWNTKTKTLEKLIEPKFEVGDKVRHKNNHNVVFTITNIEEDSYVCGAKMAFCFDDQNNWELSPNKFDITTLIPFESKVLVRGDEYCLWKPAIFGFYNKANFYMLGGTVWKQCIPYEDNEKLLGTTGDCDEYYKTWK